MAPSCKIELERFSAMLRIPDGAKCGNYHLGDEYDKENRCLTCRSIPTNIDFATLGSILDSQLSWESSKFHLARWSHEVALFLVRIRPDPTRRVSLSQLLLTRFWWNFKGRFLGISRTGSNCHGSFVQATFVLATFVHIRNISAVTDMILGKH